MHVMSRLLVVLDRQLVNSLPDLSSPAVYTTGAVAVLSIFKF